VRRVLTLLVVLAAVAVAGVLLWREASSSTGVSADDAVAGFRERGEAPAAAVPAGLPAPGVYTYRARGRERGTVGPVSVARDVPPRARAVVATGPGRTVEVEWRISEEHTEAYRYRVSGGWWSATWRRVDVTFLRLGRDDRRDVEPAARWVPVRPRVGQTWPVAFRTGTLATTGRGRVLRRATLPLDGRREPVFVIRTATRTTGAHGGERREDVWWSPRLGMPLRLVSDTRLRGVAGFSARLDMVLESGVPRR
jgi:hypothetical protein